MNRTPIGRAFIEPMLGFFKQNGPTLGAVDVVCSAGEPGDLQASAVLLLLGRKKGSAVPLFSQVRVVLPEGAQAGQTFQTACAALIAVGGPVSPDATDIIKRLHVRTTPLRNVDGLLAALGDAPRGAAVIVARSASYLPMGYQFAPGASTG